VGHLEVRRPRVVWIEFRHVARLRRS
jgi:hypothetical protein